MLFLSMKYNSACVSDFSNSDPLGSLCIFKIDSWRHAMTGVANSELLDAVQQVPFESFAQRDNLILTKFYKSFIIFNQLQVKKTLRHR